MSIHKIILLVFINLLSLNSILAQPDNKPGADRRSISINGRDCDHKPRPQIDTTTCADYEFRTLNGTCNNLSNGSRMEWGATDIRFKRDIPAAYGASNPFGDMGGENRITARGVSNYVIDQPAIIFSEFGLSAMVYNWGQFLDHDVTLTPESELEYEPIELPDDEPLMDAPISFHRSEFYNDPNDGLPREQINILTAWVDGSQVYGSELDRVEWLRSGVNGKLKVSSGDLLPFNTIDGEYDSEIDTLAPTTAGGDDVTRMWVAGDLRVGEQPGLTALHTLFVREHNRICDELVASGMTDDDEIYENARKKVIALLQKITYKEFIPSLGLDLGDYEGYNANVDPNITSIFATAAYRLGHTMVVDSVQTFDNDCNLIGHFSLADAFFNTDIIVDQDIDPFLKGISVETQYEVDPYIVDELRDFLFTSSTAPLVAGLDLGALNIQRGRDHGLPDYNTIREYYVGSAVSSFDEISSVPAIVEGLETAYDDIDDIDAWVGLLCEDRVSGTSLGITMHAILEDQFKRLREGDRFYYENEDYLTDQELAEINSTTLKDVILRNTSITNLQDDVMYSDNCFTTSVNNPSVQYQIKISPNPSTGIITIENLNNEIEIDKIEVVNNIGQRLLFSQQTTKLDLSQLANGNYFVRIKTNKGYSTHQISIVK